MVSIRTNRYMRSHGKNPRGRGNWAFVSKEYGEIDYNDPSQLFMAGGNLTAKDAAQKAKKWAKEHGHDVIYIAESFKKSKKVYFRFDENDMTPYDEGYDAYIEGIPVTYCPYKGHEGHEEDHEDWEAGWYDAAAAKAGDPDNPVFENKDEDVAYEKGYWAYIEGTPGTDCPYQNVDGKEKECEAWNDGWLDASNNWYGVSKKYAPEKRIFEDEDKDKKIRQGIKYVRQFNKAESLMRQYEMRNKPPTPAMIAKAESQRENANRMFFSTIAPDTPKEDQDLVYYGWPEETYEWVAAWFDDTNEPMDEIIEMHGDIHHDRQSLYANDILYYALVRGIISQEQYNNPSVELEITASELADGLGDLEEIGTSDVSIFMKDFVSMMKGRNVVPEGPKAYLYESKLKAREIYERMMAPLKEVSAPAHREYRAAAKADSKDRSQGIERSWRLDQKRYDEYRGVGKRNYLINYTMGRKRNANMGFIADDGLPDAQVAALFRKWVYPNAKVHSVTPRSIIQSQPLRDLEEKCGKKHKKMNELIEYETPAYRYGYEAHQAGLGSNENPYEPTGDTAHQFDEWLEGYYDSEQDEWTAEFETDVELDTENEEVFEDQPRFDKTSPEYQEGYKAFKNGIMYHENPYEPYGDTVSQYDNWEQGWHAADDDSWNVNEAFEDHDDRHKPAWRFGYTSHKDGKSFDDNPYQADTVKNYEWEDGWMAAEYDANEGITESYTDWRKWEPAYVGKAFVNGYKSYRHDLSIGDNPYNWSDHPVEHDDWEDGWHTAQEEDSQSMNESSYWRDQPEDQLGAPWSDGHKIRMNVGGSVYENPWPKNSEEFDEWEEGWYAADDQIRGMNESDQEGYNAYFDKKEPNDNPYDYESDPESYANWEEGFHAASYEDWGINEGSHRNMISNPDYLAAYDEGRDACESGSHAMDNPYSDGIYAQEGWWALGWEDCHQEIAKSMNESDTISVDDGTQIWNDGYNAYLSGDSIESNPYPAGSMKHDIWNHGYHENYDDNTFDVDPSTNNLIRNESSDKIQYLIVEKNESNMQPTWTTVELNKSTNVNSTTVKKLMDSHADGLNWKEYDVVATWNGNMNEYVKRTKKNLASDNLPPTRRYILEKNLNRLVTAKQIMTNGERIKSPIAEGNKISNVIENYLSNRG